MYRIDGGKETPEDRPRRGREGVILACLVGLAGLSAGLLARQSRRPAARAPSPG